MLKRLTIQACRRTYRYSQFSSVPNQDLKDLFWAQSYIGTIKNMFALLTSSQEREFYRNLKKSIITKVPKFTQPIFAFRLYCELKNPVIVRYNFNHEEFLVGAKECGQKFFDALVDPQFIEYMQHKSGTKPDCVEFVESVSSPVFLRILEDAISTLGQNQNLRGLKIKDACLLSMVSECRQAESESDRSYIIQRNNKIISATLASVLAYPHVIPIPPRDVAKELFAADEPQPFTYHGLDGVDNSVLVTLDVYYDADLNYGGEGGAQAGDVSEPSEQPVGKASIVRLTFHGCISGQTDLDWKVISIGFRK